MCIRDSSYSDITEVYKAYSKNVDRIKRKTGDRQRQYCAECRGINESKILIVVFYLRIH